MLLCEQRVTIYCKKMSLQEKYLHRPDTTQLVDYFKFNIKIEMSLCGTLATLLFDIFDIIHVCVNCQSHAAK